MLFNKAIKKEKTDFYLILNILKEINKLYDVYGYNRSKNNKTQKDWD